MSRLSSLRRRRETTDLITELTIIAVILAILFLIFFLTSSRYPTVWMDEVSYSDPAVNLYLGNGFTSSAWYAQTKDKFWAGNVPLHAVLLYGWMQLFGFSQVAIRSMNLVLVIISALMIWFGAIRLKLVTSSWSRVTLIVLILSGYGVSFCYQSGRPDGITIILLAAAILTCSIAYSWLRCSLLSCIGILMPIAGLQMIVYASILCGLLLIFLGKSFIRESISLASGLIVGIILLYILYSTNGVWYDFLASIKQHSAIGHVETMSQGKLSWLISEQNSGWKDFSFWPLFILMLSIAIYKITNNSLKLRSVLSFGLTVSVCTPIVMILLGKYAIYYSWMSFIPLSICVCSVINEFAIFNSRRWTSSAILGVLLISCLVGLPLKLAAAAPQWENRNYAPVEALVERNVSERDWVYCDYRAYYAVKKRAAVTLLPSYLLNKEIPSLEKQNVSILIIDPKDLKEVTSKLGGEWYDSGKGIAPRANGLPLFGTGGKTNQLYRLQVFRKSSTS